MNRIAGWVCSGAVAAAVCVGLASPATAAAAGPAASRSQAIDAAIRDVLATNDLHAVIVQVTVNGKTIIKKAYGWSQTGVRARTDMRFRNGNVVALYMSTLLLRLVEQGKAKLDDPVSKYVPNIPDGDRVTLRMLAGMTAGYEDYVRADGFVQTFYGDPFANFSTAKQLALGLAKPVQFTPGTNWAYAHTNYVILGLALEKITGLRLETALRKWVLRPLGLRHTEASQTAAMSGPVLHTYSSERRGFLGIPAGTPFLEETTFWNPSWTFARGSVETTNITDLTRTAIGIGEGKLLSRNSYRLQMDPRIGFGEAQANCLLCRKMTAEAGYGLGIFRNGSWLSAQPLFAGLGSVAAYNPSKHISIAVTAAFGAGAFDADGAPTNYHKVLYNRIAQVVAPGDTPPS